MQSIKKKLVEIIFYIFMICCVILLFYRFTIQNTNQIENRNEVYAADALRQIAARIDDQFKSALNLIKDYAYFLERSLNQPNVTIELLREMEKTSLFDGLRFTNLEGINYSASGDTVDTTDREFYQEGIKGNSGIALVMKSRRLQQPILGFYTPLRYDGKIIGVLHGAYLSEKYLRSMLETTYFGRKSDVFLCSPAGEIIASSSRKKLTGNIYSVLEAEAGVTPAIIESVRDVFRDGGSGVFSIGAKDGVGNLCVMYLPGYNFVLAQTFPQNVTNAMIRAATDSGLELELGLLALFAIYAAFLILRARQQKRKLEKENSEYSMLSKGLNMLFSTRYCLVNLENGQYNYISGGKPVDPRLGARGSFENWLDLRSEVLIGKEHQKEFREFFGAANLEKARPGRDILTFECHVDKNGEDAWENLIAICIERKDDKPVRFLIARQDVTEMKRRELQTKRKISTMDRKERQYRVAVTSNTFCSYEFNVSRDLIEEDIKQTMDGREVSRLALVGLAAPCKASDFFNAMGAAVLPESREEYEKVANMDFLAQKYSEGQFEVDVDYWRQNPGDEEICVRQAFYLTRDDLSGDIVAMTVMRDITRQVIAQREQTKALKDALMLAQHANDAKTTFLSNMSHDIRTPMNAIIGFSTIAASHLDNREQVRDCLQKVLSSSNHLLSLINDILDMSRIESGKLQIKEQECNISELMHNLVTIIQPQVKAKQMRLFIDTFEVTNEDVITDPLKLNQVFINLLSNAVKYTPAGGVISFRLTQKPAFRHGWADYVFVIKDNGIGMSEEFVKHIFEPFTRETSATLSGIQGTGLGMAITKNIIELLNGAIEVETKPGEGSKFTVTLTMRIQDASPAQDGLEELEGLRALVVDDDFHTCDSVSKMLKKIGLRSEWTTSGREATHRAQLAHNDQDPFHTYIIDWQMPDLNGVETARRIRKIVGDDAPIIILTAYEWADIEEEAREAGITAFCAKPLFMSDLRNALLSSHNLQEKPERKWQAPSFKNARILVVDDVEMNREVAEFILRESGFEVATAPDGTDAVEMVSKSAENYYSAILMDVQMPTMNGYEATRAIRTLPREDVKTMPIIAMTANALEEDRAEALKSGMNDHISKPIDIKKFYEVIRKFFQE